MNTLKDKVILVTGGAQGLGAAICKTLAEDQATVIAVDVKLEKLDKVVSEIKSMGGKAKAYQMDVCSEKSVEEVINRIILEFGKLDVVVNNAGVDHTKSIEELTHAEFNQVIHVNLCGPFNVSKAAFTHMKNNRKGYIINIVSTAAKRAWANASAYHASKWGLLGFSHALHVEARQHGIKVTALIAGGMQTPFILERFPDVNPNILQDPKNVAENVKYILYQQNGTVIPEMMVIPMTETSWP